VRRRILAVFVGVIGLTGGACLEPPKYACTDSSQCVLNNVMGTCDVAIGTCLYSGPECMPHGVRDAHGRCVVPTTPLSTSGVDTSSGQEQESSSSGAAVDSGESTWGTGTVECGDGSEDITAEGNAMANSVWPGYPAAYSVDGDLHTSWFSEGPAEGDPVAFTWRLVTPRCIKELTFEGNAVNDNPDWRTNYGFASVTVSVLDEVSTVMFEETQQLPGTPDPPRSFYTGGVVGTRVVLQLRDHENDFSGGFAELVVIGE
jgi:hypothetical protein